MFGIPWLGTALRLAPWGLFLLAVAWAGWERNGRKDAELANVNQQKQILEDANKTWVKVNTAREEFDEQVAAGLAKLSQKQRDMETTIDAYRKAVSSDPGSMRPLSPSELASLRLLSTPNSNQAGGSAVRPANQSAPVR